MKITLVTLFILLICNSIFSESIEITDDANIRRSPSMNSEIIRIGKAGEKYSAESFDDDWYLISNSNEKEYVNKSLTKTLSNSKIEPIGYLILFVAVIIVLNVFKNLENGKIIGPLIIAVFSIICSLIQKGNIFDLIVYVGLFIISFFIITAGSYIHPRKDGKADRRFKYNPYETYCNDEIKSLAKILLIFSVIMGVISYIIIK